MWWLVARLARRLGLALLSLALVISLTTALFALAPGRFGDEFALDPGLAPDAAAAVERRIAEDTQTSRDAWRWFAGALRGELGRSLASGIPVGTLLVDRVFNTLVLTVPATLLAWTGALLAVSWTRRAGGRRQHTLPVHVSLATLQAMPDVVIAMLLVWLAVSTGWLPVGGYGEAGSATPALDAVRHAALPVAGLALGMVGVLVRPLSGLVQSVDGAPFIEAARARGVTPAGVYWRHLVPAALPIIAPLVGLSSAALLSASAPIEVVFAWPGLGALLIDAVFARDLPVVLGSVFASAMLLVASNACADVLQRFSDPRLRTLRG